MSKRASLMVVRRGRACPTLVGFWGGNQGDGKPSPTPASATDRLARPIGSMRWELRARPPRSRFENRMDIRYIQLKDPLCQSLSMNAANAEVSLKSLSRQAWKR